jgi:hypothetical protein
MEYVWQGWWVVPEAHQTGQSRKDLGCMQLTFWRITPAKALRGRWRSTMRDGFNRTISQSSQLPMEIDRVSR